MDLNGVVKRQLFLCFEMMENLIRSAPDSLWNEKRGGFVFWQQIYHALTGAQYWLRTDTKEIPEPYCNLKLYPELEHDPESNLSKKQILKVLDDTASEAESFFDRYSSAQLLLDSVLVHDITGLDVVLMQIRHLQYHIGHCEGILREEGADVPDWLDIVEIESRT
ncbi:MAG: DinB family protein [Spirochaetales bacterium]|nr:DinB family protein [Spirochaetales bacterium]